MWGFRDFHRRISSSKANTNLELYGSSKLNPQYITGFVDGEGCFSILIVRNKKMKLGWSITLSFQIHLHSKDKNLLIRIKDNIGNIGGVYDGKSESCLFLVSSLSDIVNVLIPFFDKYPLLSKKREDFELFKMVALIMNKKQHLTEDGFLKVLAIKAAMRKGLTEALAESFPNIKPIILNTSYYKLPNRLDPYWIAGFTEAEGSFMIHIQKKSDTKLGVGVKLKFQISQHERDKDLLTLIILSLNCGSLINNGEYVKVLAVWKFNDIFDIIIPFYAKYALQGDKKLNYLDFIKAANLIKNKAHLTQKGLDQILDIKEGMNKGRK